MGFFDKLFGKKGENNDLMKILQQNQMSISTSINYQFACIYLRNISFSVDVFDKNYKNNENTAKWIATALNSIKLTKRIPIGDEYYNMSFKFAELDDGSAKAIIIEVSNPKFECECNYVGIVKKDNAIRYYTNELYAELNSFFLCEFVANGSHRAYNRPSKSIEEFAATILNF